MAAEPAGSVADGRRGGARVDGVADGVVARASSFREFLLCGEELACVLAEARQSLLVDTIGEPAAEKWWPHLVEATGARVGPDNFLGTVYPTPELLAELRARALAAGVVG